MGKTLCPPKGDISSPSDKGSVSQFLGNRYVEAGSRRDPGACVFSRPHINTMKTTKLGC